MIEAAIALILERGIVGLRLTDVGLRAGYSRGLAAMRFGNLGGLLRHVAAHLQRFWLADLGASVGSKKGLPAIFASIDSLERSLRSPTQEIRVQFLIFFYSMDPSAEFHADTPGLLSDQRRDLEQWVGEATQEAGSRQRRRATAEAGQILSSMVGIVYQSLMDPGIDSTRMFARLKTDIAARLAKT